MKLVKASGEWSDVGEAVGSDCRRELRTELEYVRRIGDLTGVLDEVEAMLDVFRYEVEAYSEPYMELMRGMARGSGLTLDEVTLIHVGYEAMLWTPRWGCTSFAVCPEASSNGDTVIGQTIDLPEMLSDCVVTLHIETVEDVRAFIVCVPGMIYTGINSEGVGLCVNMLNPGEVRRGVPASVVSWEALMTGRLSEALNTVMEANRASGMNYLLADKDGNVFSVETTPDRFRVLEPVEGLLVHANHYVSEAFRDLDALVVGSPDTLIRNQRLRRFLEKHRGRIDERLLHEALKDHSNYPDSICCHPDPEAVPEYRWKTVAVTLYNLTSGRARVFGGNPCEASWSDFKEFGVMKPPR